MGKKVGRLERSVVGRKERWQVGKKVIDRRND